MSRMAFEEEAELLTGTSDTESDADELSTDISDSEEDPTFEIGEELSRLSINNKSRPREKSRISKSQGDAVALRKLVPELDAKDQKSFETVHKIIDAGQVEKLKVDQCKIYLRKYGLRLTGTKHILIERIKEHHDIIKGSGESKYPASSFVLNCKGDACAGDVVMFEQNVYEMFSIASRSATGPPCGTRVVAGRIVKESYGAAKQQHTFTIEVLWSKGEKPLPPLHPLLIKGRNLYRLKTMRQKWEDEGERQKKLMEKHNRGSVARANREARVHDKERRKNSKANRVSKTEYQNGKEDERDGRKKIHQSIPVSVENGKYHIDDQLQGAVQNINQEQQMTSKARPPPPPPPPPFKKLTTLSMHACANIHQRQPLTSMNYNYGQQYRNPNHMKFPSQSNNTSFIPQKSINLLSSRGDEGRRNEFQMRQGGGNVVVLICRYYLQGRCYYGERCKYVHTDIAAAPPNQRTHFWAPARQNYH